MQNLILEFFSKCIYLKCWISTDIEKNFQGMLTSSQILNFFSKRVIFSKCVVTYLHSRSSHRYGVRICRKHLLCKTSNTPRTSRHSRGPSSRFSDTGSCHLSAHRYSGFLIKISTNQG